MNPNFLENLLEKLPKRNAGRRGVPGDPLNLLFLGTAAQIRGALAEAGWIDLPLGVWSSTRAGFSEVLRGQPLRRFPPMNLYRLEGKAPDYQWVRVVRPIAERHHFRLWRTDLLDEDGREIWWGSGNYDRSIRWRDLSHVPDPDMDLERDFIARTLEGSRWVEAMKLEPAPDVPRQGFNDKGYAFRSDGRVLTVILKAPPTGPA